MCKNAGHKLYYSQSIPIRSRLCKHKQVNVFRPEVISSRADPDEKNLNLSIIDDLYDDR